jgi:hypothetical protein
MDRSHYSTLAVCHALDAIGATGDVAAAAAADWGRGLYDLVLVLDGSPQLGLQRRRADHIVPPPWDNLLFLEALRSFYQDCLPRLCGRPLVRIDVGKLSPRDLLQRIEQHICALGVYKETPAPTLQPEAEAVLRAAGRRLRLGRPYLPAFEVLGRPAMYFRQHSLILDRGVVAFFDDLYLAEFARSEVLS